MDGSAVATDYSGMTLGQALGIEIERRDVSQREAAEQIGVTQQVLSRWISGQHQPKALYVSAIARFLRVPERQVREMRAEQRPTTTAQTNRRLEILEAKVDDLTNLVVSELARRRASR